MILTKTCSKCGEEKPFSSFSKGKDENGLHIWCKDCCRAWAAEYYRKNKEKILEAHHRYHLENYESVKSSQRDYYYNRGGREKAKEYRKTHREQQRKREQEWRDRNREHYRKRQNEYYHKNKDKAKKWNDKYKNKNRMEIRAKGREYAKNNRDRINIHRLERLHNDPIFKMKEQTRNMVRYALRSEGHRKNSHTADILGCDLDFFCEYLMKTWEKNYGEPWSGEPYHIDHIVPLATAKTEEDVLRLCHYTNLQMLTPHDNLTKSDSI